jgi:outer membrane receptor protein involved in Fe transport
LDKLDAAFHRPEFVANLDINMKASKTLVFNINVGVGSKTPYTGTANGEIYYNVEFINLGAGVEYMFTRSFSVFLNASNLLNRKNEVWHGYKLPGTGVLGGVTVKF